MKNPQSYAEEILKIKHIESIAKNSCCAMVFLWCLHIEPEDDLEAIKIIDDAITDGVIDNECLVYWAKFGKWLTGREIEVEKKDISTIRQIKERTPVFYSINGVDGHWVGVENGRIGFNPKKTSKNVSEGRPVSMRKIIIKGASK